MPTTLVPTVHERLARCGLRVFVDGLVSGADVVLSIDGVDIMQTATGGGLTFVTPSLAPLAVVRAKQDSGAGFTPWSPDVIVEDAVSPPVTTPVLPDDVGACSQCVLVTNMVPGCDVELRVGQDIVGRGTANSNGETCVGVDLRKLKGERGPTLLARMIVCGAAGPDGGRVISSELPLPTPQIIGPLFGCQSVVRVRNLRRGARCRFESDRPDDLGSICSCWTAVNVFVIRPLITNERVRAQAYWDARPCDDKGDPSDWELVVPPDDRIKPIVREALIDGDQIIRVENQIANASLMIKIAPDAAQPAVEFGPRPASTFQEIALNDRLVEGNVVSVVQTLCGVSRESDPVVVQPRPPVVDAPVIIPPLFACARAVQVSNLHPGALVRLFMDGIPIGLAWAGDANSIAVGASPLLVAGGKVTATQQVGAVLGPESAPVQVQEVRDVRTPRILEPVAFGDTQVWLSGITPGSHVVVRSGGTIIGAADTTEPIARVTVTPVTAPISVTAELCATVSNASTAVPIESPCNIRTTSVDEAFRGFGTFHVPPVLDGGDFDIDIEGQLYFPSTGGGTIDPDARNLPLVVIAHGYWTTGVESYRGYDYLAQHLVRWGMLVYSLNMDTVNMRSSASATSTQQYSRGEVILETINRLLADSDLGRRINRERIGLIGHSMGGEGVVVAQLLNESQGRGFGITGVVSIAPTHWRPEVVLRHTKYMQILGSFDQLTSAMTGTDAAAVFSGFRIYDRAWRPKTHFWAYGLRHNPFNRIWVQTGDTFEEGIADLARPPQDHERAATCLINAFFQDALRDRAAYAGYMEGTILPGGIADLEIHTQHSKEPRTVLDNFGDADDQAPLAGEALDRTTNRRGQAISADASVVPFDDIEHTGVANSPHNTKGVELGWNTVAAFYSSVAAGIGGAATEVMALRIGQFWRDDTLNPVATNADAFVTLSDGAREATVRLGAVAAIPYPDAARTVLCPMRTIRLPLDAFQAVTPGFDVGAIQSVTLRFTARPSGHVLADDLEVGR
jgi:hypothetical protein